jgi:ABC-type sugar transport system permease subunit
MVKPFIWSILSVVAAMVVGLLLAVIIDASGGTPKNGHWIIVGDVPVWFENQ